MEEEKQKTANQQAAAIAKAQGSMPDSAKRILEELNADNAVDWRTELDDCGDDESHAFAPERSPGAEIVRVDHRGDVLVARSRAGGALAEVVKLDGRSGALLWRRTVARPGVDGRPTTHAPQICHGNLRK